MSHVKMLHLVRCKVYLHEMMRLCELFMAFIPPGAVVMGGASHATSERVNFVAAVDEAR